MGVYFTPPPPMDDEWLRLVESHRQYPPKRRLMFWLSFFEARARDVAKQVPVGLEKASLAQWHYAREECLAAIDAAKHWLDGSAPVPPLDRPSTRLRALLGAFPPVYGAGGQGLMASLPPNWKRLMEQLSQEVERVGAVPDHQAVDGPADKLDGAGEPGIDDVSNAAAAQVRGALRSAAEEVEAFARQLPVQFELRDGVYRSRTDKHEYGPRAYPDAQAVIDNLGNAVTSIEAALRAMGVRSLDGELLPSDRAHLWVQWQRCQAPQQWQRLADELIPLGRSILTRRSEYVTNIETIDNSFTVFVIPAAALDWAAATAAAVRRLASSDAAPSPSGDNVPTQTDELEKDGEKFVFRRQGVNWLVRYGVVEGSFPDRKGMGYIASLLRWPNPSSPMSALDLAGKAMVAPEGDGAKQPVMDPKQRRDAEERLKDLSQALDEERGCHEPEDLAKFEEERDRLVELLAAATGLGGRDRDLAPASAAARAARAVRVAIDRAIKDFREATPPMTSLADHLRAIRSEGDAFKYEPGPNPPPWSL